MPTERKQPSAAKILWTVALFLTLGGSFFLNGCDRPSAPDSTASSSSTSVNEPAVAGAVLRADPNPVPPGDTKGRTTITWDTGSDAVGDVYVVDAGNEKLFASGRQGSEDAPWIHPGSNEFRLYKQDGRKLLAQLTVTMPASDTSASKPAAKP